MAHIYLPYYKVDTCIKLMYPSDLGNDAKTSRCNLIPKGLILYKIFQTFHLFREGQKTQYFGIIVMKMHPCNWQKSPHL